MSPARKRETPLSEMSQLDAHLNLSHTLLDVFSHLESIIQTLLPILPRCSRRNQGVVVKLLRQIHIAEGRFSLEDDARFSCATNCEIRLTYALAGSYSCASWTTRVEPLRHCHHSSRTTWALDA
jgi:hypothetical protein